MKILCKGNEFYENNIILLPNVLMSSKALYIKDLSWSEVLSKLFEAEFSSSVQRVMLQCYVWVIIFQHLTNYSFSSLNYPPHIWISRDGPLNTRSCGWVFVLLPFTIKEFGQIVKTALYLRKRAWVCSCNI